MEYPIKIIIAGLRSVYLIARLVESKLPGIDFSLMNTGTKTSDSSKATTKTLKGEHDIGDESQLNHKDENRSRMVDAIRHISKESGLTFIVADFSWLKNIKATYALARFYRKTSTFTIIIVARPCGFEEGDGVDQADQVINTLITIVDAVIVIPVNRIKKLPREELYKQNAYEEAGQMVHCLIKDIYNLITSKGMVGIDMFDVKAILSKAGGVAFGIGQAKGKNRIMRAIERALDHPLLEHVSIADAKSILFTLAASEPTMEEITEGSDYFYNEVGDHKDMIWGAPVDKSLGDYMRVMVLATGINVESYIQGKQPKEFVPRGQVRDMMPGIY